MTLEEQISKVCVDLSALEPAIGNGKGKEYEVREYLREAIKARSNARSWAVVYSDLSGALDSGGMWEIKLRGAPGYLEGRGDRNYTHFLFLNNFGWHELHLGLQYSGRSRGGHEVDISMISSSVRMRESSKGVRVSGAVILMGIECKDYIGDVGKHLVRSFVLTTLDHRVWDAIFRTSGTVSKSGQDILQYYGVRFECVP